MSAMEYKVVEGKKNETKRSKMDDRDMFCTVWFG